MANTEVSKRRFDIATMREEYGDDFERVATITRRVNRLYNRLDNIGTSDSKSTKIIDQIADLHAEVELINDRYDDDELVAYMVNSTSGVSVTFTSSMDDILLSYFMMREYLECSVAPVPESHLKSLRSKLLELVPTLTLGESAKSSTISKIESIESYRGLSNSSEVYQIELYEYSILLYNSTNYDVSKMQLKVSDLSSELMFRMSKSLMHPEEVVVDWNSYEK